MLCESSLYIITTREIVSNIARRAGMPEIHDMRTNLEPRISSFSRDTTTTSYDSFMCFFSTVTKILCVEFIRSDVGINFFNTYFDV